MNDVNCGKQKRAYREELVGRVLLKNKTRTVSIGYVNFLIDKNIALLNYILMNTCLNPHSISCSRAVHF